MKSLLKPKTKSSVRRIPLSDDILDMLDSFKERIEKMISEGKNKLVVVKFFQIELERF